MPGPPRLGSRFFPPPPEPSHVPSNPRARFIAYHGVWYQSRHADPMQADWCAAAGHVHVGTNVSWDEGRLATEQTLRTVIQYVDSLIQPYRAAEPYCETTANSAGFGAWLSRTGSASIAANDLTLVGTSGPPSKNGLAFYGFQRHDRPWGNGRQCVTGQLFRVQPPFQFDAAGTTHEALDLNQPPFSSGAGAVMPGSTVDFQLWYRDPDGGGSQTNSSNGLEITFCP